MTGSADLSFGIVEQQVGHPSAAMLVGDVDLLDFVGDHHDKAGDLASDHGDRGIADALGRSRSEGIGVPGRHEFGGHLSPVAVGPTRVPDLGDRQRIVGLRSTEVDLLVSHRTIPQSLGGAEHRSMLPSTGACYLRLSSVARVDGSWKTRGMAGRREIAATRLILIRNARDVKRDPARLHDHDDLGLSDEGRSQATRLRDRLAATEELAGTTRLLTSNARKTIETAQVISPALGGLSPEPDCGFCEPHSGECVGISVEEWLRTLGQERLDNWSPYAPKSPGGESFVVAVERAAKAFVEAILANEGGTVVIVTQTVPLRASLWVFLGLPFHASYLDVEITDTGITEWVADGWLPGIGALKARLVRYNDHGHLLPQAWSDAAGQTTAATFPS